MKKWFFLLICLLTPVAFASSASESLTTLLKNTKSMQAHFVQTTFDNHQKAVQKSTGLMAMQRPGKFRWDVQNPMPQLIVANGSRLWIYDRDLQQVTIRSLHAAAGDTPALLLSDVDLILDKKYEVRQLQNSQYELTPRSKDAMFASIKLSFKGQEIQEMSLKDHLGHRTSIRFDGIKLNPNLSSAMFVFKAPRHVDVIDETKK